MLYLTDISLIKLKFDKDALYKMREPVIKYVRWKSDLTKRPRVRMYQLYEMYDRGLSI